MDQAFLLISPMPNWRGGDARLGDGLELRRLRDPERPAADGAERDGYWLCYEFENPHPEESARHSKHLEAAFRHLLYATYATQILIPCGATSLYHLYRRDAEGLIWQKTERRQAFLEGEWGRRSAIPGNFETEAPTLMERMHEVFYKPDIRYQIPVWLLEQGMAAPDPHIRILLCATGLDGLTKASGQNVFKERLCNLLGADRLIFPADESGRQPGYRVGEVAGHLYQLRNEMAHALPFSATFHRRTGFLDVAGAHVAPEFARYRYDKVLEECALFLLCAALREALLSRLIFDVHMMEWRGTGQV